MNEGSGLPPTYMQTAEFQLQIFRVKLGANDLNCVDVLLNPTHSLAHPVSS